MVPELTYSFYRDTYHGALTEEVFRSSLVSATARLVAITGDDIPERSTNQWFFALSVIVERAAGKDTRGTVKSETVGATSITYTDTYSAMSDFDAVRPFLASTGLLFRGVECR